MPATSRRDVKPKHSLRRAPAPASLALEILRTPSLEGLSWLVHGFSTRPGGMSTCYRGRSLNLGFTEHDTKANVERNRGRLLSVLGATNGDGSPWALLQAKQIHSAIV